MIEHRVGQLWQRRIAGGAFEVVALEGDRVQVRNIRGNRRHWIRRDRLKPKAYRLLRDVTS